MQLSILSKVITGILLTGAIAFSSYLFVENKDKESALQQSLTQIESLENQQKNLTEEQRVYKEKITELEQKLNEQASTSQVMQTQLDAQKSVQQSIQSNIAQEAKCNALYNEMPKCKGKAYRSKDAYDDAFKNVDDDTRKKAHKEIGKCQEIFKVCPLN